jgi:8-amino-7-oxononanoate synthase
VIPRAVSGSDLLDKLRALAARREEFDADAAFPGDTVIDEVLSASEVVIKGRRTLMLGSNNYLGLTFHPEVRAAARDAVDRWGAGTTGSRVANGTLAIHTALERELAAHFGKRHAVIFTTGYQANLSVVAGLCRSGDVAIVDADSHASIYDAARLSGATTIAFRHNSPDDLARKLARLPSGRRDRLVVVEGVYSVRGDAAPLKEISAVCREHGAYLMVDEAHSFGAFGARGLGRAEAEGVLDAVDFLVGTFSKALGNIGGFCVSDRPELDSLRFLARSYVFTASSSPATIESVRAALRVLAKDSSLRDRLWANTRRLRARLEAGGCPVEPVESPIVSILVGEALPAVALWQRLLEAGVYVNIMLPPACPHGACLLRASCSAAYTTEEIDRAAEVIASVVREAGVRRTAGAESPIDGG